MKISQVKQILEDPSMKNKDCNFKLTGKSKEPSWFTEFKLENDKRWEEQQKINNSMPAWFKEFKLENDKRWEEQQKINNSMPAWFKEFKLENDKRWEEQDKRWDEQFKFNKMIIKRLDNIVTKNNLKE